MVNLTLVTEMAQDQKSDEGICIFTDGACSGNPGPGGWGVLVRNSDGIETELLGGEIMTTNNRMELMAAIKGLESLSSPCKVTLYTDSLYLKDGMTKWILNWRVNNWHDAVRRQIKNLDLWQRLDHLAQQYNIDWQWVRGHSGHSENERVDLLARNAIIQMMMQEKLA